MLQPRLVLIDNLTDHEGMFGYVLITLLLIAGPLAVLAGVDSRVDEKSRQQHFTG